MQSRRCLLDRTTHTRLTCLLLFLNSQPSRTILASFARTANSSSDSCLHVPTPPPPPLPGALRNEHASHSLLQGSRTIKRLLPLSAVAKTSAPPPPAIRQLSPFLLLLPEDYPLFSSSSSSSSSSSLPSPTPSSHPAQPSAASRPAPISQLPTTDCVGTGGGTDAN